MSAPITEASAELAQLAREYDAAMLTTPGQPIVLILAYVEALRSALTASGCAAWQPIETAPKDGTRIIAYGVPLRDMPAAAYTTRWKPFGVGSMAHEWFKAGTGPEGGFWYEESDWTQTWKPTHWMPLPKAPK